MQYLWMVGLESPFQASRLQNILWRNPTTARAQLYQAIRQWGVELFDSGLMSSVSMRRVMQVSRRRGAL